MKVMKAMRLFMVAGFALSIFISANPGGAELVTSLPGGTVIRMPEMDYQGYGPKTFGPDNSVILEFHVPVVSFRLDPGCLF